MVNNTALNLTSQSLLVSNQLINKIVIAILIFFVGLIIGRIVGKLIEKLIRNFSIDKTLQQKTGMKINLYKFLGNTVSFGIYIIFLIIGLNYIGITHLILNILAILVIFILAVTVFLSLKDSIPNIVAYSAMTKYKSIRIGDKIKFDTVEGKVKEMNFLETVLETDKGDRIHIPNRVFTREAHVQKQMKKHKNTKTLDEFRKKK